LEGGGYDDPGAARQANLPDSGGSRFGRQAVREHPSWPAKAGDPRLYVAASKKVVDGRPSPAMTVGAIQSK
jgi:hypothetical protein